MERSRFDELDLPTDSSGCEQQTNGGWEAVR